jgi:flagellar basal body-associated protein FliL
VRHGVVWYEDPVIVVAVALVIIIAAGTVIFAMRRYSTKKTDPQKPPQPQTKPAAAMQLQGKVDLDYGGAPFKISKSVQGTMASTAKNELRMLDLEREILGDAIRRLYEAQAEGKITEVEREKLAASYKQRMNTIKESITKDESIIALHELESMQEDLMKLFSERFGELTTKVEELRGRIDVKPIREIPVKMPKQVPVQLEESEEEEGEEAEEEETAEAKPSEEKPKRKRKPPEEKPTQKTEAERRIESIRSEVEKVLDKLGQMEIEG